MSFTFSHTYCIVPTLLSLNMSFMSVTMMWIFEFSCLFCLFQMVYNLPDESCFLISTVKGQLIMLGKVILPVRRLSRCMFDKEFNVLFPSSHFLYRWTGRRTPSNPKVVRRTDGITKYSTLCFGAEASLRPSRPASTLSSYFLPFSLNARSMESRERLRYSHVNVRIWHGCVHCFILKTLLTEESR